MSTHTQTQTQTHTDTLPYSLTRASIKALVLYETLKACCMRSRASIKALLLSIKALLLPSSPDRKAWCTFCQHSTHSRQPFLSFFLGLFLYGPSLNLHLLMRLSEYGFTPHQCLLSNTFDNYSRFCKAQQEQGPGAHTSHCPPGLHPRAKPAQGSGGSEEITHLLALLTVLQILSAHIALA